MNDNDIIKLLQDANLQEAVKRSERRRAEMPADLNERVMVRIKAPSRAIHLRWRWAIAAACVAGLIAGLFLPSSKPDTKPATELAQNTPTIPTSKTGRMASAPETDTLPRPQQQTKGHIGKAGKNVMPQGQVQEHAEKRNPLTPELMDGFIAQMAERYEVDGIEMNCDGTDRPGFTIYVLPDSPEVLDRLYQLVLFFDPLSDKDLLTFSDDQFYLEMMTVEDSVEVRDVWLAERVHNRVCLYRTHYKDEDVPSTQCLPFL